MADVSPGFSWVANDLKLNTLRGLAWMGAYVCRCPCHYLGSLLLLLLPQLPLHLPLPLAPNVPPWSCMVSQWPPTIPYESMNPYISLWPPMVPRVHHAPLRFPMTACGPSWSPMIVHESLGPPWSPTSSRNTQGTLEEHYGSAKRILGSAVGVLAEY